MRNTGDGLKMLIGVDKDLIELFTQMIFSESFDKFYAGILSAIKNKKRVYISGCGATGRLAMRLEASFR